MTWCARWADARSFSRLPAGDTVVHGVRHSAVREIQRGRIAALVRGDPVDDGLGTHTVLIRATEFGRTMAVGTEPLFYPFECTERHSHQREVSHSYDGGRFCVSVVNLFIIDLR